MNLRYHVFYDEVNLVYQGSNRKEALKTFEAYGKLSKAPGNHVTGDSVSVYDDYTLIKKYNGRKSNENKN